MQKRFTPEWVITLLVSAAFLGYCIYYGVKGDGIKCVQALALALLAHAPRFVAKKARFDMGQAAPILFCAFITMAVIVGTFMDVYFILPYWDKLLHATSGVMIGVVAYNAVETVVSRLFSTEKHAQVRVFVAFVAFCVSCAAAVMWETYEFTLDRILDMNCQRYMEGPNSGLMDTMWDVILGSSGGAAASIAMCAMAGRKAPK